ncbi:MAG: hypothetical protein GWM98_24740, partial [Nitrospinaceae bacterium]|nr:hypothetical protein [Nitrospinaceae bacterium]NIR57083.1 hypothetical protein [Nitrospinaceae bacterium]NIS87524.1 hypothetical protein [Nitrospinaceae bacterium]NIT84394.1 hypothetical protein [Nitrospinaceae bacterium]NIU46581.1 hypothetical protein [Nitrospinaceae bacterium]
MRSFQQIRWMVAALAFFVLQGLPSEMGKTDATRVPFQILPLGVSEADAQTTLPELTIRVIAHLEFGQIAAHPS